MMNDLDHSRAAPLVRGLFLGLKGGPAAVAPLGDGIAEPAETLSLEMPGAYRGDFDEGASARILLEALGAWRASRGGRGIPDAVSVRDGDVGATYLPWSAAPHAESHDAPAARDSLLSTARRNDVVRGRVALVTGGAQGFGEEIVRGLAASAAIVFIADLNAEGAARLAAELDAAAGRTVSIPVRVDVTDADSVRDMFRVVAGKAGGADLVVSNAGVLKAGSVLDQDIASFKFVTDVNYTGFFNVTKYAGLLMRRQGLLAQGWKTDIVQINSKSGLQGSNRNGAYAGSKFGGIGLVQSFAMELVEYGIKVNAICPGNFFDGPLWSDPEKGLFAQYLRSGKVPGAKTAADVKAFYEAKVPMRRGCAGPDVMRALYYLVEQEYETGQALPITGGQVMLA